MEKAFCADQCFLRFPDPGVSKEKTGLKTSAFPPLSAVLYQPAFRVWEYSQFSAAPDYFAYTFPAHTFPAGYAVPRILSLCQMIFRIYFSCI